MIAKVYQHKETKRYLTGILQNGDIETVKQPIEARKWEIDNEGRMGNFRLYDRRNGEILQARGYEVVMIEIGKGEYR